MNLVIIVYLLGLAEKANTSLGVTFGISLFSIFILLFIKGAFTVDLSEDIKGILTLWIKRAGVVALISGVLFTLVPTKEISYAMLAAYGVEEIVTNERVQDIGGKSLDLLEKTLDEYLSEKEGD